LRNLWDDKSYDCFPSLPLSFPEYRDVSNPNQDEFLLFSDSWDNWWFTSASSPQFPLYKNGHFSTLPSFFVPLHVIINDVLFLVMSEKYFVFQIWKIIVWRQRILGLGRLRQTYECRQTWWLNLHSRNKLKEIGCLLWTNIRKKQN